MMLVKWIDGVRTAGSLEQQIPRVYYANKSTYNDVMAEGKRSTVQQPRKRLKFEMFLR